MDLVGQLGPGSPRAEHGGKNSSITCFTSGPNGALSVASLIRVLAWRAAERSGATSSRSRQGLGSARSTATGSRAEGRRRRRLARRYNLVAGRRRAKIILTGIEPSGAG